MVDVKKVMMSVAAWTVAGAVFLYTTPLPDKWKGTVQATPASHPNTATKDQQPTLAGRFDALVNDIKRKLTRD
jgi:hypothetical protein